MKKNMQTFLPFPNSKKSAQCLDWRRLGKQRVESYQIHLIVSGQRTVGGWINHPAVTMWRGFADALADYHNEMIDEWVARGYQNNMDKLPVVELVMPYWWGDEDLHASHRSNLLRKDYDYYSQFGWTEPSNLEYVWK